MRNRLLAIATALAGAAAAWAAAGPATTSAAAAPGVTGETVAFYALALLVGGSALGCVLSGKIVRMALCLLGTLGGVALLYFLMSATFLGVIQLIVYAGGTLIVIVFGVMLTTRLYGPTLRAKPLEAAIAGVVCLALFVGLASILTRTAWPNVAVSAETFPVAAFGQALLTTYLVPFEVASVLLLAVMIGAAFLAQPAAKDSETK